MPELTEYRQDAGGTVATRIDANGYLRVDGVAAKTGVLTYLKADGSVVRELVTADALFNEESMSTLSGSPVTIGHPAVGLLNSQNASSYSKGAVASAKADGGNLGVGVTVTNDDAIAAVNRGTRQLSPGYTAVMDYTPGVTEDGQHYDAIQVSRSYNHLAIVDSARGGPECKINLDGFSCAVEVPPTPTTTEVIPMPTVKLTSGATVEVADASTASTIQADLNALSQRADAADKMIDQAKYDELQGKYDALSAEMEKMKEAKQDHMDAAEMGSFIETVEKARKMKPDLEIKKDGKFLTEVEVMAGGLDIEAKGQSAEYLKGRFDSAFEMLGKDEITRQRETKQDGKPTVSAVDQHRSNFYGGKA